MQTSITTRKINGQDIKISWQHLTQQSDFTHAASAAQKGISVLLARVKDTHLTELLNSRYLPQSEIERSVRMKSKHRRDEYLWSRTIIRHVLAIIIGVTPDNVALTQSKNGKPMVVQQGGYRPYFNISHSQGYIVCAFSHIWPLGVDIEIPIQDDPYIQTVEFQRLLFCDTEQLHINQIVRGKLNIPILKSWTRKEAILKAAGTGLSMSLKSICVLLGVNKDGVSCNFVDYALFEEHQYLLKSHYYTTNIEVILSIKI